MPSPMERIRAEMGIPLGGPPEAPAQSPMARIRAEMGIPLPEAPTAAPPETQALIPEMTTEEAREYNRQVDLAEARKQATQR